MATVPTIPASYAVGNRWRAVQEATPHAQALNLLLAPPQCEVANHAGVTTSVSTWALVPFDAETYDTDAMHDLVTNPSRVIAQTAGRYSIAAAVSFQAATGGDLQAMLRLNAAGSSVGGTLVATAGVRNASALVLATINIEARDLLMTAGQYVELFVWQSIGAARATTPDAPNTYLRARYIANS